jgi:hypothetical protein
LHQLMVDHALVVECKDAVEGWYHQRFELSHPQRMTSTGEANMRRLYERVKCWQSKDAMKLMAAASQAFYVQSREPAGSRNQTVIDLEPDSYVPCAGRDSSADCCVCMRASCTHRFFLTAGSVPTLGISGTLGSVAS